MQPDQGLAAGAGCRGVAAHGNLAAGGTDKVLLDGNARQRLGAQQARLQFAEQAAALHIVQLGCGCVRIQLGKAALGVCQGGIDGGGIRGVHHENP